MMILFHPFQRSGALKIFFSHVLYFDTLELTRQGLEPFYLLVDEDDIKRDSESL